MRFVLPLFALLLLFTQGCAPKGDGTSATTPPTISGPSAGAPPMTGTQKKADQLLPPGK